MSVYKFRDCVFDVRERRFEKCGEVLKMTSKTLDILTLLVEKAGEVVTKDELLGKVWSGTLVEEGNLSVHISKLRRVLEDGAGERYIETISGTGYRFIPSVDQSENGTSPNGHTTGPYDHLGRDSEAIRYYLKGRYFFEKLTIPSIHKAIIYFEKASAHDPENVYACADLIESYRFLYGLDSISHKAASNKITSLLEVLSGLNQDIDVVHLIYGNVAMFMEWSFDEAEKHLLRALSVNPSSSSSAQYRYTQLLVFKQKFSQAIKELRRMIQVDSYSLRSYLRIGKLFYWMGYFENALIYTSDAIELEPDHFETLIIHGAVLAELGRYSDALNALRKSLDQHFDVEALGLIGYINGLLREKTEAHRVIGEIEDAAPVKNSYLIYISRIHFALGENDVGYTLLEKWVDRKGSDLIGLNVDPRWNSVRHEKRFKDIVRKVGLPVDEIH
jgi:DNA-binding winged helix-turn-helix (wHTH) protein/tetratricopeptide (TPR) repeat protein